MRTGRKLIPRSALCTRTHSFSLSLSLLPAFGSPPTLPLLSFRPPPLSHTRLDPSSFSNRYFDRRRPVSLYPTYSPCRWYHTAVAANPPAPPPPYAGTLNSAKPGRHKAGPVLPLSGLILMSLPSLTRACPLSSHCQAAPGEVLASPAHARCPYFPPRSLPPCADSLVGGPESIKQRKSSPSAPVSPS